MAREPRAPPDEAEGDEHQIVHEHGQHEPKWGELVGAARGELAEELDVRVEDRVVVRRCGGREGAGGGDGARGRRPAGLACYATLPSAAPPEALEALEDARARAEDSGGDNRLPPKAGNLGGDFGLLPMRRAVAASEVEDGCTVGEAAEAEVAAAVRTTVVAGLVDVVSERITRSARCASAAESTSRATSWATVAKESIAVESSGGCQVRHGGALEMSVVVIDAVGEAVSDALYDAVGDVVGEAVSDARSRSVVTVMLTVSAVSSEVPSVGCLRVVFPVPFWTVPGSRAQ